MRSRHEKRPVGRTLSVRTERLEVVRDTDDAESFRRFARAAARRAALVEAAGTVATVASVVALAVAWLGGARGVSVLGVAMVAFASAAVALRPWTLRAFDVVGDAVRGTTTSFGEWWLDAQEPPGSWKGVRVVGASAGPAQRGIVGALAVTAVASGVTVVAATTAGSHRIHSAMPTSPSPPPRAPRAMAVPRPSATAFVVSRDGGTGVVVRAANTSRSARIGALSHRAHVLVLCEATSTEGEPTHWFRIEWEDAGHAWVAARYLEAVDRWGPVSRCD